MSEWKRGELQAIGAAARLMILGGGFVVLFTLYLDFNVSQFLHGLPGALITSPFRKLLGGAAVLAIGCRLGVWLWRVRRRTGISSQPFDRSGNP